MNVEHIKSVKDEGLLRISGMSSGMWYKALMENYLTADIDENGFHYAKHCRIEMKHPNADWDNNWPLARMSGLESADCSFLWRMIHNLLPCQVRLHRILKSVDSPLCLLCDAGVVGDLLHSLFFCSFNNGVGKWLIRCLTDHLDYVNPEQLVILDLHLDAYDVEESLPTIWLTAKTLGEVWQSRVSKKPSSIFTTRATLEANIMLLRKTRFSNCADKIQNLINTD